MSDILTPNQKKDFMRQAHKLQPVVRIGNNGLTCAVHIEIERALESHELIKIRISGAGEERKEMLAMILERHQPHLINSIGFVSILYRKKPEPPTEKDIKMPEVAIEAMDNLDSSENELFNA